MREGGREGGREGRKPGTGAVVKRGSEQREKEGRREGDQKAKRVRESFPFPSFHKLLRVTQVVTKAESTLPNESLVRRNEFNTEHDCSNCSNKSTHKRFHVQQHKEAVFFTAVCASLKTLQTVWLMWVTC